MKWELTVEEEPELLYVRVSGVFGAEGFSDMVADFAAHPRWHQSMDVLVDYRAADATHADFAAIQAAVEAKSQRRNEMGRGRVAVLVGDDLTYGLGRVLQSLSRDRVDTDLSVFREESEARAWLEDTP